MTQVPSTPPPTPNPSFADPGIQDLVEYIDRSTWRGAENANATHSLQGLMQHVSTGVVSRYWLDHVYTPEIRAMVTENRFHIHDLGYLSAYCSGWSTEDLLVRGFGGVANKV